MEITKSVQLLQKDYLENSQLFRYDFLDLESNLPFSVYPKEKIKSYESLEFYKVCDVKFNLVLQKSSNNGNQSISWKVKAVAVNK